MSNPHNRKKHVQHRSWFAITLRNDQLVGNSHAEDEAQILIKRRESQHVIVRPVNGETWFEIPQPGFDAGIVHMIDEDGELVGFCEIGYFERNAKHYECETP